MHIMFFEVNKSGLTAQFYFENNIYDTFMGSSSQVSHGMKSEK